VAGCVLVTGGSGIALGLPDNFVRRGMLEPRPSAARAVEGPGIVLSGSCSAASRQQVDAYARRRVAFRIEPEAVLSGEIAAATVLAQVIPRLDEAPIIYSTAGPERVQAAQERFGRERVARALEQLFGELAARLVQAGVRRIVVGGGETAGAVVQALGIDEMAIGPEIDPGVPALYARHAGASVGLALKSGNFGGPDFYASALAVLAGRKGEGS
jgi:uncharacterized protein YgbK (DUF1537 family)